MARDVQALANGIEQFLGKPGSVTGVTPLSTGHSNETYLIHGLDVILRTPPESAGLLPPYDMRQQHDVLAELRQKAPAVPVPEVLGVCEDPSLLGAPFYLCSKVAGESFEYEAPEWVATASADCRWQMCAQWIGAIAELHRCGPFDSLGPVLTPEQEFGAWRDRAARNGGEHGAAIAAVYDRLAELGYARSGDPTPVHGDPKIGNTMWQDGTLTAVLDWEIAHNGEPLSDLGYILCWFPVDGKVEGPSFYYFAWEGMFSRADVIAEWERRTGRSARGVEVYEVASWTKIWAILHQGATAYQSGTITDERIALWGQTLAPLREHTERLLAIVTATAA